jgi:hypothetical protein
VQNLCFARINNGLQVRTVSRCQHHKPRGHFSSTLL